MGYAIPREEYIERMAPVIAAGLCAGPMANAQPQVIVEKAMAIIEGLANKQNMKTRAQLDAEYQAERKAATPT